MLKVDAVYRRTMTSVSALTSFVVPHVRDHVRLLPVPLLGVEPVGDKAFVVRHALGPNALVQDPATNVFTGRVGDAWSARIDKFVGCRQPAWEGDDPGAASEHRR